MKKEQRLEKIFSIIVLVHKGRYFKIPDTKMINKNNRYEHREEKRPFDGVLATKSGNWCVEFKVNYNRLTPHQVENKKQVDKINGMFAVITEIQRKKGNVYRLQIKNKTHEFSELVHLVKYFLLEC